MKIVPMAKPNADGEWIEVETDINVLGLTWVRGELALRHLIPADHFTVTYQKVDDPPLPTEFRRRIEI